jgi:polyhydroxyalkanoate synthase
MAQDPTETPTEIGERAANVLAPESSLFEDLDAAGFGGALAKVLRAGVTNPLAPGQIAVRLAADLARVPLVTAAAWLGRPVEPPVPVDAKDRRFADPAWTGNPLFHGVRLSYLVACRAARDLVAAAGLDEDSARKAAAATELMLDALAPTNFLATNPRPPG